MIARVLATCALCFSALSWAAGAHAQTRFTRNDYTVDLVTGPLLGGGRIVGMSGAYAALATGIDGAVFNPAGYAERYEKEINWFAFDVTGGLWLSGVFARNDFDNNGAVSKRTGNTYQTTLGTRLQFSYFGTGVNWHARLYELRAQDGRKFDVILQTLRAGAGYSFLNGGLVGGFTVAKYDLTLSGTNTRTQVNYSGYGGELGVLIRPANARYRLGLVMRTPVSATPNERSGVEVTGDQVESVFGLILPNEVHVPWEITVGFAYQFGERRTNTPWRNTTQLRRALREQIASGTYVLPDRYGEKAYESLPDDPQKALDVAMANYREAQRRYRRHQPRRYVLLSSDLILYGKTQNGHGIDAFLNQVPERSGEKISVGVRFGVESEIWPDRVKVRAGTYLEPSRFARTYYRPHGTTGFDVRLFDIWRWSVRGTATIDLAPRYFNYGIAFGLWW